MENQNANSSILFKRIKKFDKNQEAKARKVKIQQKF
jgi:hypothetical protein